MTYDAVISNLYAAANGRAPWSGALTDIATHLDLWTVQVLGIDKRDGRLMFSVHGGQSTAQTGLDYFRHYHYIDPRVPMASATPLGEWFHCHQHFDDAFVARNPFYQEFLIPYGGRYVSTVNLVDNGEVLFMLALLRGNGKLPLPHTHEHMIGRFGYHFAEAMKNLVHTRETFAELGMARELLDPLNYPMLLVDETRGIWHRNRHADALLRAGIAVTERSGMLVCRDKADDNALNEAISALQERSAADQHTPARQVVRLTGNDGKVYLAFISAVGPGRTMGAFGTAARALVILHDPNRMNTTLDPLLAAECFDFTPAEARIAVQLVDGANAKEIAQRNGVALPTVRTHIQRLMEKTGVDRQTDLLRILMSLPVRGERLHQAP